MSDIVDTLVLLGSNEWTADLATVSAVAREAKTEIERLRGQVERLTAALGELTATVRGKCPSLLNEDSGGNARLALEIEELLAVTSTEQP